MSTALNLTPENRAALRKKFTKKQLRQRPIILCSLCDKGDRSCRHRWLRCEECGAETTEAHGHIAYVPQTSVRERFDKLDPNWRWEPMALTEDGAPVVDEHGGLWIRLTVLGVTRIGYGRAERGHQVNESINRAIRNCARDEFGVGLYLADQAPTPRMPRTPTPVAAHATPLKTATSPRPSTPSKPAPSPHAESPVPEAQAVIDEEHQRKTLRAQILDHGEKYGGIDLNETAQEFQKITGHDLVSAETPIDVLADYLARLRAAEEVG